MCPWQSTKHLHYLSPGYLPRSRLPSLFKLLPPAPDANAESINLEFPQAFQTLLGLHVSTLLLLYSYILSLHLQMANLLCLLRSKHHTFRETIHLRFCSSWYIPPAWPCPRHLIFAELIDYLSVLCDSQLKKHRIHQPM